MGDEAGGDQLPWDRAATHYEVLNIAPTSEPVVITAAYRALIKKYHPDSNRDDERAAERARRLREAFEVLSDARSRALYDATLSAAQPVPAHGIGSIGARGRSRDRAVGFGAPRRWFWPVAALGVVGLAMVWLGDWPSEPEDAPSPGEVAKAVAPERRNSAGQDPRLTRRWLIGRWVRENEDCDGPLAILLREDSLWIGRFDRGSWSLNGDKLTTVTTSQGFSQGGRLAGGGEGYPPTRTDQIHVRGPNEIEIAGATKRSRRTFDRCRS